jgi:hypothetical protein
MTTPQPPLANPIAHCSFLIAHSYTNSLPRKSRQPSIASPLWPQSAAQGIVAEIPQADRREAEELKRKARPAEGGMRPKTKTA